MGVLKHTEKGSTLVEVLVAMVIILACMGVAMTIYSNLARDVNDELKIRAEIQLNTLAADTKRSGNYTDGTLQFETMRIEKTVLPYRKSKHLRVLQLEAYTPLGRKITSYHEIIILP